jgi:hypothetical protein
MVSIDCATTTVGDVTLVTLSVSSTDPTHVRIENCLDGPVWPPREQGVPAAGWDDGGFSGVVDGRLALGYACPAEHSKGPPAELIEERPPAEETAPTACSLVRELGDGAPPPAAVGPADGTAHADDPAESDDPSPPPAVTGWLGAVSERIARGDRLADATTMREAVDAVDAVGGADEVRTLRDQLATDRETLAAVGARCRALAANAETVEIPVETLARLA